jgi:5'-nucleotidase
MNRSRLPFHVLATLLICALTLSVPAAQTNHAVPYRILITNDDGVRAPGILAVAKALTSVGDVTVVAPAENQSGKGHAISITDPIFADAVALPGDIQATALTATPASCVKVAVEALMPQKPNLVVSGINRGYNLAAVTYVSGTVGAAREAALMGIPAIAASLSEEQPDYTTAAKIVAEIAGLVRKNGLEPGAFLNVNVPAGTGTAIKGIQLTRQSMQTGVERFEEQRSPTGRRYFWSVWNEPTGDAEGTDVWAVEHGYVAVTPLHTGEFDPRTYEAWRSKMVR